MKLPYRIQDLQDQDPVLSCPVYILPTDRKEAPAWQRQSGYGTERDSLSGLRLASRNRVWGLLGRDKPEEEQREGPGPGLIE